MYVNFDLLEKKEIEWKSNDLLVLQCIRQKEYERLEGCRNSLLRLFKKELVVKIASHPKNKPPYLGARLTMKAKAFLRDLQVASVTEESLGLAKSLIELYEQNNLTVGNRKEIVELVSWFLAETQEYTPDMVYDVVADYVNSTERKFIRSLYTLIWKGKSVFSTNWSLSDSKLYELMKK